MFKVVLVVLLLAVVGAVDIAESIKNLRGSAKEKVESFMKSHPDIVEKIQAHPDLLEKAKNHPELAMEKVKSHPEIMEKVKAHPALLQKIAHNPEAAMKMAAAHIAA